MTHQMCTFYAGGHLFGLHVLHVQEVLRAHIMTPIPLAPPTIAGLINLRGEIVIAIDLRRQLGMEARSDNVESTNIIVRDQESVVSLIVDEIGDVVEVDETMRDPVPATLTGPMRRLIGEIYKFQSRLILALDANHVVEVQPIKVFENRSDKVAYR